MFEIAFFDSIFFFFKVEIKFLIEKIHPTGKNSLSEIPISDVIYTHEKKKNNNK
jgi:hypothetical protein